jgi:hypothetical protein
MLARAQLAVGALLTALIASGCTAPSRPEATPIRFEISDLSKPEGLAPVVAQSGAVFDVPVVFRIEVRVVGTGSSGEGQLRVNTTSYTPECNGVPVPESFRTKQIVLPTALTTEPDSHGMVQHWPLSTSIFSLASASQCPNAREPWYPSFAPQTGSFHIRAQIDQSKGSSSAADLTIRVGQHDRRL